MALKALRACTQDSMVHSAISRPHRLVETATSWLMQCSIITNVQMQIFTRTWDLHTWAKTERKVSLRLNAPKVMASSIVVCFAIPNSENLGFCDLRLALCWSWGLGWHWPDKNGLIRQAHKRLSVFQAELAAVTSPNWRLLIPTPLAQVRQNNFKTLR